nr:hypothetical protein [Gammaproteobacteria bacterium]
MRKIGALLLLSTFLLTGCNFVLFTNDDSTKMTSTNIEIVNKTNGEYTLKNNYMPVWYIQGSDVPYVDVKEFINSLDGFFNAENITSRVDVFNSDFAIYVNRNYPVIFNWANNTIQTGSYYNFYGYCLSGEGTNFSHHLSSQNVLYSGNKAFKANLNDYDFDIYYHNNKCIVPLFLMNSLFCSLNYVNVLYNGEKAFVCYAEPETFEEYYDCSSNKKNISSDLRKAANNSLFFLFDTFYGLKLEKNITDGSKEYVPQEALSLLELNTPQDNFLGYKKIINKTLDDLHTRISIPSYYCDPQESKLTPQDIGEFYTRFLGTSVLLKDS